MIFVQIANLRINIAQITSIHVGDRATTLAFTGGARPVELTPDEGRALLAYLDRTFGEDAQRTFICVDLTPSPAPRRQP